MYLLANVSKKVSVKVEYNSSPSKICKNVGKEVSRVGQVQDRSGSHGHIPSFVVFVKSV
jgi:hypothetical protein